MSEEQEMNNCWPGPEQEEGQQGDFNKLVGIPAAPTEKKTPGEKKLSCESVVEEEANRVSLSEGDMAPEEAVQREESKVSDSTDEDVETGHVRTPIEPEDEVRHPGAFCVGGDEDDTIEDIAEIDMATEGVTTTDDTLLPGAEITAELVDAEMEAQHMREEVERNLQSERAKAPVAELVHERFCHRRRATIVVILALLAILGVVLGITLAPEKSPPPAPVPPEHEIVELLSAVSADSGMALQTSGSPQNKAFLWIANDTFLGYRTNEKLIQRYALATLFFSTNGISWLNNSLWLDNDDECGRWWQRYGGISCKSKTGAVASLGLEENNLRGPIPAEIGLLTSLEQANMAQNHLSGTIPESLLNLTSLQSLNLVECSLVGSVPENVTSLSNLKSLNLAQNYLSGTFVANIGKLTKLESLMIWDNNFSGSLPNDISRLKRMKNMNFRSNQLTNTIPTEIGQLSFLSEVSFSTNNLNGSIPSEIGLMTKLKFMILRTNRLTGAIPSTIGKLTLFKDIHLQENELSSTIPSEIALLSNLGELRCTGSILGSSGILFHA